MPLSPTDLVLHHHDAGIFSQKARTFFGMRSATWRSILEPMISPKPTLARLTGGYERVPVLQVGADIFCDSKLVLVELGRRLPGPAVAGSLDAIVNAWVDKVFVPATFGVAIPDMVPSMDPEFAQDRADIYGPSYDVDAIIGAAPVLRQQWRAQVSWLEQALATSGGPFLCGDTPTAADAAAYMPLWMCVARHGIASWISHPHDIPDTPPPISPDPGDSAERLLDGFERVRAWRNRMASFGEGDRHNATADEGFALAAASQPENRVGHDRSDPSGLAPGTAVTAIADDSTRDPVIGTLIAATAERIVLSREEPGLGTLHVHLPRFSYFLSPK
jgi:glutathione S-transferase